MEVPVSIEARRPRRQVPLILTLAVCAALGGFLISYLFPPHYTATSTVMAEDHFLVIPVITADFAQFVDGLGHNVLATSLLRPKLHAMLHALNLGKPEDEGKLISEIRQHMQLEPVITTAEKEASSSNLPVLGFSVEYTDRNAVRAQRICNALTSLIVDEYLRMGSNPDHTNVDFWGKQIKLAKDDLEHKRVQLRAISKSPSPGSPKEEATYKALALDYANAQTFYKDLLAKVAWMANSYQPALYARSARSPLGKDVRIDIADLPDTASLPNRLLFSLCGLDAGLLLGIGRVLWFMASNRY